MAIFTAITIMDTHKEEIGLKYFPDVLEYIGQFTMKGLMDCSGDLRKAKGAGMKAENSEKRGH